MSDTITCAEPGRSVQPELVLSWVEVNISKQYHLGQVGTLWLRWLSRVEASLSKSTLRGDLQRPGLSWSSSGVEMGVEVWWHTLRGKEDPTLKIGQTNQLNEASRASAAGNSKLQTRNSKLENDYVWALRNINLEVKQGEILGIIGKNGAEKSTLLKLLSRVTSPTTGFIKVKSRIASLLEVGTWWLSLSKTHPEHTGRENIFLNGAILGVTRFEKKQIQCNKQVKIS